MEQGFIFSQKQQLIFSQKQIQSLKLLAMDNYELSTFLQEEYNENPLLDVKSSDSAVSRPFSKASVTSDEAFQPDPLFRVQHIRIKNHEVDDPFNG